MVLLNLKQMQSLFTKAVQEHSWIAGIEGVEILGEPGYRKNEIKNGDFLFEERYYVSRVKEVVRIQSTKTIYRKGRKVWSLFWKGHCSIHHEAFLKESLKAIYTKGIFSNGHAVLELCEDEALGLILKNKAVATAFTKSCGRGHLLESHSSRIIGQYSYATVH